MNISVSGANIEATAYGLLALIAGGDITLALPVVKWLSAQRNTLGGFSSTQVHLSHYINLQ